jgi:RNA polymerase sigma factor (sigma-70 family)
LGAQGLEEREDARQAIFLRIFANLGKWDRRCPFCKWLAVVAARRAIDFTRASELTRALPLREVADPRPTLARLETIECIETTIARFPSEWHRAFELATQGVSREEIARTAGKSVRTIHYWLAEIRDQLQQCMDE